MQELNPATVGIDAVLYADEPLQVVDARRRADYDAGHIPGALSLPLWDMMVDSPAEMAAIAGAHGVRQDVPVAVYDDTHGAVASRVAWDLEFAGHRDVKLLEVTYSGWIAAGLDTAAGEPVVEPARWKAEPRREMLATHDAVGADEGGILLDNRDRLNFLERHIPGAVNVPYRMLGGPDGRVLRAPEDLRRLFGNRGIGDGVDIITYCGSAGTLSGLAYYALKEAGIRGARLYANSFREWSGMEKPTETQPDANYWDLSAE